jgi:hypothetical protein
MSKVVTRGLKRQLELDHYNNLLMRWFNHKNNHVFKPKEHNQLNLPAMNLNNLL